MNLNFTVQVICETNTYSATVYILLKRLSIPYSSMHPSPNLTCLMPSTTNKLGQSAAAIIYCVNSCDIVSCFHIIKSQNIPF